MRYVTLLRGINVGPHKRLAMADLRDLAAKLDLGDPHTLLASGNLVFDSPRTAAKLELLLEAETKKRFALATTYYARSAAEWEAAIDANPFPREAKDDPGRFIMLCFRGIPAPADVKGLQAAIVGRETIRTVGRQGYAIYPDGQGESKFTLPMIEKALRTTGTGRNWNTVLKIGAALS